MSDYPNERDCEHGNLRRQCAICELEAENKELRARLGSLLKVLEVDDHGEAIEKIANLRGHIKAQALRLDACEKERDEAARRAGAAERHAEYQSERIGAREQWLRDAKAAWGVDDRVSFDVVWKEALALRSRELRDTQEDRGHADPLYSMLLERIEQLMQADPAADSIDGARLLELVGLCEAYEKRQGQRALGVENKALQSRLSDCESALRSLDVGRESSYWVVEKHGEIPGG